MDSKSEELVVATPPCPDCGHFYWNLQEPGTVVACPTSGQRYILEDGDWVAWGETDEF